MTGAGITEHGDLICADPSPLPSPARGEGTRRASGKTSLRQRLLDHIRKGGTDNSIEIKVLLKLKSTPDSIAVTLSKLRAEGLIPRATLPGHALRISIEAQRMLYAEAAERRCTLSQLANAVLLNALRDNLVDEVLDGERP